MGERHPDVPVLDESEPAVTVLARQLGISHRQAREALRALVKAGYVIGPREPTNAMLLAYITSYGQVPVNPATTITAVGKARRRWQAMADKATAMALSTKRLACAEETPQAAGGRARARNLTPARRSDIARKAARTRWGIEGGDGSEDGEKT